MVLLAGLVVTFWVATRGLRSGSRNAPTAGSRDRPKVAADRSVLDDGSGDAPPVGRFLAVWVAGATLAGVGQIEGGIDPVPYLLVGLLAIPAAIGTDLLRAISFSATAVFGLGVGLAETVIGACGEDLEFGAVAMAVTSVLVLVVVGVYRMRFRPGLSDGGAVDVLLAAVPILQLARSVLRPGGLAVLGLTGLAGFGVQVGTGALLLIVGAMCGLRPRVGASLVTLGVLVLNFLLGAIDTPCGLDFMALVIVALIYTLMVFGLSILRGFLPPSWRG